MERGGREERKGNRERKEEGERRMRPTRGLQRPVTPPERSKMETKFKKIIMGKK